LQELNVAVGLRHKVLSFDEVAELTAAEAARQYRA
jgi:hypothetical protein